MRQITFLSFWWLLCPFNFLSNPIVMWNQGSWGGNRTGFTWTWLYKNPQPMRRCWWDVNKNSRPRSVDAKLARRRFGVTTYFNQFYVELSAQRFLQVLKLCVALCCTARWHCGGPAVAIRWRVGVRSGLQMSQIPGFITKPWFLEGLEYGRTGKFSRSGRVINGYNMIIHDLTTNIRYRMLQY